MEAAAQEWLTEHSPFGLLSLAGPRLSEQRLRYLIGGITRLLADELPAKYRPDALSTAEQLAAGVKRSPAITRVRTELQKGGQLPARVRRLLTFVAGGLGDDLLLAARARLREILGTPPVCETKRVEAAMRCVLGNPFRAVAFDPAWRTSDVIALAHGIHEERAFDRMPILADALQDAGCNSDDILNHSRDPHAPHARGCWVVDLVLNTGRATS